MRSVRLCRPSDSYQFFLALLPYIRRKSKRLDFYFMREVMPFGDFQFHLTPFKSVFPWLPIPKRFPRNLGILTIVTSKHIYFNLRLIKFYITGMLSVWSRTCARNGSILWIVDISFGHLALLTQWKFFHSTCMSPGTKVVSSAQNMLVHQIEGDYDSCYC